MTSIDNVFKADRFSAYLIKFLRENRNHILIGAMMIALIPILYCIVYPYISDTYMIRGDSDYYKGIDLMWEREMMFFTFLWLVIAVATGGVFYEQLKTKTGRISLFTCPASSFEKFLTSFTIYIIGYSLVYICGIFLADAIRVWIYTDHHFPGLTVKYMSPAYYFSLGNTLTLNHPSTPEFMKEDICIQMFAEISALTCGVVFLQAFFALGSSVWPKNSSLKTMCFLIPFSILCGWLVYEGFKLLHGHGHYEPRFLDRESPTGFIITLDCIVAAVSVFLWWVGFRRFKEWEVIKRW